MNLEEAPIIMDPLYEYLFCLKLGYIGIYGGNGYLMILVRKDRYGDKESLTLKVNMREGDVAIFNRLVGRVVISIVSFIVSLYIDPFIVRIPISIIDYSCMEAEPRIHCVNL